MSPTGRQPARDITLEGRVARLETSVESLHKEKGSIAATLAGHGEALSAVRQSIARAFSQIGKHDGRISTIEHRVAGLEAQGSVVQAAGSGIVSIVVRVVATGVVALIATIIALVTSRGVL